MNKTLFSSITGIALAAVVSVPFFAFANNGAEASAAAHATNTGSARMVTIADNGATLVRGAKVTAVNGNTVTAQTTWGTNHLTWMVNTTADTDFARTSTSTTGIGAVSVGDTISFAGALGTSTSALSVNASTVKDWTLAGDAKIIIGNGDHDDDMDNDNHKVVDNSKNGMSGWSSFFAKFNFFGKHDGNK